MRYCGRGGRLAPLESQGLLQIIHPELLTLWGGQRNRLYLFGELHEALEDPVMLVGGNSGTGIRLLSGILAGTPFQTTLTGDETLQKRPMKRVMEPSTKATA